MKTARFLRRVWSLALILVLIFCGIPMHVAAGEQPRVWMFDPGHGGEDPGAIGCDGKRKEKDDNLRLALAVAERMRASGETVLLTRDTDQSVALEARSDMANEAGVTYFVSFHRNSATNIGNGAETYYHTSVDATSESARLADTVQKALVEAGYINRGVKQANFSVLRRTNMPAILLETGFMNNPAENSRFDSDFEELADGIAAALLSHVGKKLVKEEKPVDPPAEDPAAKATPLWVPVTVGVGAGVGVLTAGAGICFAVVRKRKKQK